MTIPGRVTTYEEARLSEAEQLVEEHASLVKRIAHHLIMRLPQSVQLDDLIQAGMLGLLEAAGKYDAGKGASFETYAGIRIRGAMFDEIRRGDWVPRSVHRNVRGISAAIKTVENRLGRDARDKEVATELGVPLADYHAMLRDASGSRLLSFEEVPVDDRAEPHAAGEPGEALERLDFERSLAGAIASLPEREQLVLSLYYDDELNLKEIGQVLGVSESRVSQIHSQAALRIRSRLGDWVRET